MSSNFYDTTGVMVGLDGHKYWAIVPPDPVPIEAEAAYVSAAQYAVFPVEDAATRTATLTSDGKRMIQGKCKLQNALHYPVIVPGPPHPVMEPIELALIIVYASTVPVLRRQCVTGQGQPLAICLYWALGVNLNCGEPVKMPSGGVFNLNTVKTQASWQDAVPTIVDWIIDSLVGVLFKKMLSNTLKKKLKEDLERELARIIQKMTETKVKDFFKDVVKMFKDKVKPKKVLRDLGIPFI